jgi:hypothetical protein
MSATGRVVVLCAALFGGGCMSSLAQLGQAPTDGSPVRAALTEVVPSSFDRNLRGEGWGAYRSVNGSTGYAIHGSVELTEDCWSTEFACQKSADASDDQRWRLPASEYSRVLGPVRTDVLTAIEKTGVEVSYAPAIEFTDGPNPEARFVICYLRNHRAIAGKVFACLKPVAADQPDARDSKLELTVHEWNCK